MTVKINMSAVITLKAKGQYAIEGELNMHSVPEISQQLVKLVPQVEGETLTFDLSLISRSDSAGVALLVEAMQLAKAAHLSLNFSNLPQQMQDIAGLSGLLDILPIQQH